MELGVANGFSLTTPPRKRQVRFSARHDIVLLREVLTQNPFATKESSVRYWALVAEIVTASLQDENGTGEQYAEKEELLHAVLELEAGKAYRKTPRQSLMSAALGNISRQSTETDELVQKAALMVDPFLPEADKPDVNTLAQMASPEDVTQPRSPAGSVRAESEGSDLAEELVPAFTSKPPCRCCCHQSFTEISLEQARLEEEKKERERRFVLESQERQVLLDLLKEKILKG
ncbi:hypothetical protein CRUP_027592 [Coryphaenoides rupestris]|nr:hypothetical protein CRUP_027592 [Coryphaenoides rupestris]